MDPEPEPLDLTLQVPRDTYYRVIHTLRGSLPPPITDTPEDLVRRDNSVMAQIATLLPVTADEVNLAATYIAANASARRRPNWWTPSSPPTAPTCARSTRLPRTDVGGGAPSLPSPAARERRRDSPRP
jgi:hypothetical protein